MAEELLTLAYPSVTGASAEARIESLRRALITLTDRLNRVDLGAMGVLRELDLAIRTRDDAAAQPDPQARAQAKALRELIVRTAEFLLDLEASDLDILAKEAIRSALGTGSIGPGAVMLAALPAGVLLAALLVLKRRRNR